VEIAEKWNKPKFNKAVAKALKIRLKKN